VGTSTGSNDSQSTLAEHWNGRSWSVVPGPAVGTSSYFTGVVATSSKEAWAVGYFLSQQQTYLPLVEYWDGRQWSVSSTPDLGPGGGGVLDGITKVPASTVIWAVGAQSNQTLIELKG
jgi:hypothetical protein